MKAVTVLCLLVAAVHSQTNPAQIPENPFLYGFHMIIGNFWRLLHSKVDNNPENAFCAVLDTGAQFVQANYLSAAEVAEATMDEFGSILSEFHDIPAIQDWAQGLCDGDHFLFKMVFVQDSQS